MKAFFRIVPTTAFVFAVAIIAVFALSASVSGQSTPSAKNSLVGSWTSDEAVVNIRANGTLTINDEEFAYKVKGGVITVMNDVQGVLMFPFSLDGDVLTVEYDGREIVYRRTKKGTGEGAATPAARAAGGVIPEFVGKWCYLAIRGGNSSYRSDRCFTLYANGTYESNSEVSSSGSAGSMVGSNYDTGTWTATRTTLTAQSRSQGRIVYPIELRNHPKTGDPMIVVDGDAYVTFTQKRPW